MSQNLKLTQKIIVSFLLILLLVGIAYTITTVYFTNRYVEKTAQELNANVASHLIDEKFKDVSPFLEDGSVNKELFGDIMHDMMAVNRSIEVYLLNKKGEVLYSVVLDHEKSTAPVVTVDTKPIQQFVRSEGKNHILGDDPRVPGVQKIFSAAPYSIDGHEGYIYIILASKAYVGVNDKLAGSYFQDLGLWVIVLTILFGVVLSIFIIRYLTRNLKGIIFAVRRFKEGDLNSRIPENSGTDFKELSSTFNEMADTIEANLDQLKSLEVLRKELAANISHDLRSPIAVSNGYVETMLMKNDSLNNEERKEYLEVVHKSIQRLTRMIEQLFEYSKFEANQIQLEKEPFKIQDLASDVFAGYNIMAEDRGIKLILEVDEAMPEVFADISLVDRVLQNLMDNALKYTPDNGEVRLDVELDQKNVKLTVKDSGPGIPKSEQQHIFERYVHGEKKEGTGLGLAIVKKIIDLHDSKIVVSSEPNNGAAFHFHLPVAT